MSRFARMELTKLQKKLASAHQEMVKSRRSRETQRKLAQSA